VSSLVKAPLWNRSSIINLSRAIPTTIEIVKTANKIRADFFISFRASSSFLFFIAFATIGKSAIEVAIAKIARGS
jgi:hypothetical protein